MSEIYIKRDNLKILQKRELKKSNAFNIILTNSEIWRTISHLLILRTIVLQVFLRIILFFRNLYQ